jgi:hypothetical protein
MINVLGATDVIDIREVAQSHIARTAIG